MKSLTRRQKLRLLFLSSIVVGILLALWAVLTPESTAHSRSSMPQLSTTQPPTAAQENAETLRQREEVNDGNQKLAQGVPMQDKTPVQPKDVDPSSLTGGCVLGYGRGRQCLPLAPPSQEFGEKIPWTCKELRTLFPDGITVNRASEGTPQAGVDPLKLDHNQNFVACDAGDF